MDKSEAVVFVQSLLVYGRPLQGRQEQRKICRRGEVKASVEEQRSKTIQSPAQGERTKIASVNESEVLT